MEPNAYNNSISVTLNIKLGVPLAFLAGVGSLCPPGCAPAGWPGRPPGETLGPRLGGHHNLEAGAD